MVVNACDAVFRMPAWYGARLDMAPRVAYTYRHRHSGARRAAPQPSLAMPANGSGIQQTAARVKWRNTPLDACARTPRCGVCARACETLAPVAATAHRHDIICGGLWRHMKAWRH